MGWFGSWAYYASPHNHCCLFSHSHHIGRTLQVLLLSSQIRMPLSVACILSDLHLLTTHRMPISAQPHTARCLLCAFTCNRPSSRCPHHQVTARYLTCPPVFHCLGSFNTSINTVQHVHQHVHHVHQHVPCFTRTLVLFMHLANSSRTRNATIPASQPVRRLHTPKLDMTMMATCDERVTCHGRINLTP